MNYLAHALLSGRDEGLLLGNFVADHLSGNKLDSLSPQMISGVRLHRQIDSYADSHPKFKQSKRFFYAGYEKYSGILVDIWFDHLLAKNFSRYSGTKLDEYAKQTYGVYLRNQAMMPDGSRHFLSYMLKNNLYEAYATTAGIRLVLYHLSHRIGHNVWLDGSVHNFSRHEEEISENFSVFFEEALQQFLPYGIHQ